MLERTISIGQLVYVRPCFGLAPPILVRVDGLEVTEESRSKYGEPVTSAVWSLVDLNRVLVTYGRSWCYSEQLDYYEEPLSGEPEPIKLNKGQQLADSYDATSPKERS